MAQPISEDIVVEIRKRYVPYVFGAKQVAKELGIGANTVLRYASDEARQKDRESSRAYKRKITGVCEECGGETRYNGSTINGPSRICDACAHKPMTHCREGHPMSGDNLLVHASGQRYCRLCFNRKHREYQEQKRRERGIPPRGRTYRRPVEETLLSSLENEGAP